MIVFCLIIASFAYASLFRSLIESEYFNEVSSFHDKIDSTKVIVSNSNEFVSLPESESTTTTNAFNVQLKQMVIPIEDMVKDQNKFLDKIQEFKVVIEKELFTSERNHDKLYSKDYLCLKAIEDDNKSSKCFEINTSSLENFS